MTIRCGWCVKDVEPRVHTAWDEDRKNAFETRSCPYCARTLEQIQIPEAPASMVPVETTVMGSSVSTVYIPEEVAPRTHTSVTLVPGPSASSATSTGQAARAPLPMRSWWRRPGRRTAP